MNRAHWFEALGPTVDHQGQVDACVVGSGAGGAPVALTLARAGYRVLVLEKGPAFTQADFVYDELRSSRRDFFRPYASDEPHMWVDNSGRATRTNKGWTANCVGGGTVHFSGFTYRLHPEDLKLRSLLGSVKASSLVDWPVTWQQLAHYYERAEYEIGVSGDAQKNPFESFRKPLPMPPLKENALAKLVDESCDKLGLHAYPTARAILSRAWGGRSACRRSFFCGSYGCEVGAKSSVLAALWPKALATGRCQIRPGAMVASVLSDDSGKIIGVSYLDRKGSQHRIAARIVVLACTAVESARLLLLSKAKAAPDGLANDSGLVGKNLMFVGTGSGEAHFDRGSPEMQTIDWREPFVNRSVQDLYLLDRDSPKVRKGGTISFLLPHGNPIHAAEQLAIGNRDVPLWGAELKRAIVGLQQSRRLEFEVFSETLPVESSMVTLDPEVRDRHGLPAARIRVLQNIVDRQINAVVVDKAVEILETMGASKTERVEKGGQTTWLQGGTCRFGTDPRRSVLDPDCRAHQHKNLFITDGSFMPTMGGVPNTLTIEANSFRVGDRIVALGKAHEL